MTRRGVGVGLAFTLEICFRTASVAAAKAASLASSAAAGGCAREPPGHCARRMYCASAWLALAAAAGVGGLGGS